MHGPEVDGLLHYIRHLLTTVNIQKTKLKKATMEKNTITVLVRMVNGTETGNMLFNGKEFMEHIYPDSGPPQELVFMQFCDEDGKRINVGIDRDGLTITEVEPGKE